jgi:hypothetical protein
LRLTRSSTVDKSVLKPEATAKLDDLVSKTKGINLEVIIAVGHTDSDGSDAYNQKLSVRRSEAVKAYLDEQGCREEPRLHRRQGREAARGRQQDQGRQGEEPPRRDRGRRYPYPPLIAGPLRVMDKPRLGGVCRFKCLTFAHDERRSQGTRQVQRTGPPLVGPDSEFKPLHEINPLRLDWIERVVGGCGASVCWTSAAAVASWPSPWRAVERPVCWASIWP